MNNKLLLHKSVNISQDYLEFISFIHPQFEYVEDISKYDNPRTDGIILCCKHDDTIINKLNAITDKWVIVDNSRFDVDLSTNEGLIKNLLPLHYIKLKKDNKLKIVNSLKYDTLLEKVKTCLVSNCQLEVDNIEDSSVYELFISILGTRDVLNTVFFNIVNKQNVKSITSSILTFLNKVQSQNINGASSNYASLIIQSNRRYGKRIKKSICRFVYSKANREAALYNLLTDLNREN